MPFRTGGDQAVRELLLEHLGKVRATVETMAEGVNALLAGRPQEELAVLARETHLREGQADAVRREAEQALVRGALVAGRRRTLLTLIDGTDRLANAAEAVMDYVTLQGVNIPELLHPLVAEIVAVTQAQLQDVQACVAALLAGSAEAERLAEAVEHAEGRVDDLERRALTRLFATDLPLAEKLLIRDFLAMLVEISDRAEDLIDLVLIVLAARPE
ncbi:TPA: DUF47 family protein [Candidatus Bipolaricaulota bacterium]|nr:DUF47 family protein [Candidatus Bipolaricaulota bacterium]